LNQEIQFSNKENSGFENDVQGVSSSEDRSIIEENDMVKRQILTEVLQKYEIDPTWIKEEHLSKMEVE